MAKIEFVLFVVPFVEWKVDNPSESNFVFILEAKVVSESDAELTEDFIDFVAFVGSKEDCVAGFGACELLDGFDLSI